MKYQGILFDLDGTLVDNSELVITSFQYIFKTHLDMDLKPEDIYPYFGRPLIEAFRELAPENENLIETYRAYENPRGDEIAHLVEGAKEVLIKLYEAGIKLAVVSSRNSKSLHHELEIRAIDEYFQVIIGCDDCKKHKPDKEPVEKALKNLGLRNEDCLFVGDSPYDMMSATGARVKTALVRWTNVPWTDVEKCYPDYILETMFDLLEICEV